MRKRFWLLALDAAFYLGLPRRVYLWCLERAATAEYAGYEIPDEDGEWPW